MAETKTEATGASASRVRAIPQRYQTSDGELHASEAEAARRQALLDAIQQFETAQKRIAHLVAESTQTADGRPFKFGILRNYWRVSNVMGRIPSVEQVEFGYDTEVDFYSDPPELVVMESVRGQFATFQRRTYLITELYADRENAEAAALERQIEWYRERVETYPALREALIRLATSSRAERDG